MILLDSSQAVYNTSSSIVNSSYNIFMYEQIITISSTNVDGDGDEYIYGIDDVK